MMSLELGCASWHKWNRSSSKQTPEMHCSPSKQTPETHWVRLILVVVEARAGLPGLGKVDIDSAATDLGLVHCLHGLLGRLLGLESDETEPPGCETIVSGGCRWPSAPRRPAGCWPRVKQEAQRHNLAACHGNSMAHHQPEAPQGRGPGAWGETTERTCRGAWLGTVDRPVLTGPRWENLQEGTSACEPHITPLNGTRARGKPKGCFSKRMGAWEGVLLAATSLAVENDVGLLDIPKLLEDLPGKTFGFQPRGPLAGVGRNPDGQRHGAVGGGGDHLAEVIGVKSPGKAADEELVLVVVLHGEPERGRHLGKYSRGERGGRKN